MNPRHLILLPPFALVVAGVALYFVAFEPRRPTPAASRNPIPEVVQPQPAASTQKNRPGPSSAPALSPPPYITVPIASRQELAGVRVPLASATDEPPSSGVVAIYGSILQRIDANRKESP
jgi:hypothetical protein